MAFDKKTLGFIENKINNAWKKVVIIRLRRYQRIGTFLRWMGLWPYFFVVGIAVWLFSFMNTPDSKRFRVWFLKHYFRYFFKVKGVDWYTVFDIGHLEPSTLILTTRSHAYTFPFVLQLFSDTVIVPMPAWVYKLRMVPLCFFLSLSRFLPLCTYRDQELPAALPNIHALLKAGYSVVVAINQFTTSASTDNTLTFYKQTEDLLRLNYPCYFLMMDGLDSIDIATHDQPQLVSVKFKEKSLVLAGKQPSEPESRLRIAEFFGYRYLNMV